MFKPGTKVEVLEFDEIIDTVVVVEDKRSEITIRKQSGGESTFAHFAEYDGWKLLFEGLGGERCFSQRGHTYQIREAPQTNSSVANEMGAKSLDDLINTGFQ